MKTNSWKNVKKLTTKCTVAFDKTIIFTFINYGIKYCTNVGLGTM